MDPVTAHALTGLAWVSFGLGHSWLATFSARAWMARAFGPWTRVAYNIIATIHLALVWGVGRLTLGSLPAFDLPAPLTWAMLALLLAGIAFLLHASAFYDMQRLMGLRQVRAARRGQADLAEDEDLRLDGPHQWVRHPLYLAGIMILWGLAFDPHGLSTAVWGTLYLVVGSWWEERKLLRLYGESYAAYRAQVPGFLPWKGFGPKTAPAPETTDGEARE